MQRLTTSRCCVRQFQDEVCVPARPPCRAAWLARAAAVWASVATRQATTWVQAEQGGRDNGSFMQASLDNRAAPYTVPMKAVPQECGALGRIRPALRFVRSVRGRECHNFSCNFSHNFSCNFSPSVLVRALPLPSRAVQRLRPWPALLRSGLFAAVPRCGQARCRTPLPTQPPRPHGARSTLAALASPPPKPRQGSTG
jgi:hypothetical protein